MSNGDTDAYVNFFRVNPWAMTKLKAFLQGMYCCSSAAAALPNWNMDELQRH